MQNKSYKILDIIACPDCKEKLQKSGQNKLVCLACSQTFFIKNGIYHLQPQKRYASKD